MTAGGGSAGAIAGGNGGVASGGGGAGGGGAGGGGAGGTSSGGDSSSPPTAAELLAALGSCDEITSSRYATDDGESATIPVCQHGDVIWWTADMDVDCDGKTTDVCNADTDPWYQAQTSATDSNGDFVDASTLPYVVVPLPSSRFDYSGHAMDLGSVIAVVYQGQVNYGVFADQGPDSIIGEASYAMAQSLGINPDPEVGGTDSGVTYIVFTGQSGMIDAVEDHAAAVSVGQERGAALVAQ